MTEVQTTKGGKRTKAVITDLFEKNRIAREGALDVIHAEAEASREAKRQFKAEMKENLLAASSQEEDEDDEDYLAMEDGNEEEDFQSSEFSKDEELKALLREFNKTESAKKSARKHSKLADDATEDDEEENMDDLSNTTQYDDDERDNDQNTLDDDDNLLVEDVGDEEADQKERERFRFMRRLKNYDATEFADPFYDLSDLRGIAQADSLTSSVTHDVEAKELAEKQKQSQYNAILLLDGQSSSSAIEFRKQVDEEWDMIEYGRAPAANYSLPLSVRRKINETRANLAFQELHQLGLQIDHQIWNKYLAVFAEAVHVEKALMVWEEMKSKGIPSDASTYAILIRMYIRNKQIDKAIQLKDEMIHEKKLTPLSETYGLFIQSFTHRDMIVESLKLLEESARYKLTLPERDIRMLRNRCNKLEVTHPNLPADPIAWVKDVKKIRHDRRHASRRKIQSAESGRW
jgi:pentatricopeptide repeat protein